jgi:hypothetical protein
MSLDPLPSLVIRVRSRLSLLLYCFQQGVRLRRRYGPPVGAVLGRMERPITDPGALLLYPASGDPLVIRLVLLAGTVPQVWEWQGSYRVTGYTDAGQAFQFDVEPGALVGTLWPGQRLTLSAGEVREVAGVMHHGARAL